MADKKIINTRLVLRNADLSAWEQSTVTLLKGEMALARLSGDMADSYKVRIGTGDKTWNQLSDQGQLIIPASNVEGLSEAITALSTSYYETDDIAKLSGEYVNGDIAVEKKDIADGKQEYCAYRYDKTVPAWKALDGNYSAENVYFKEDITLAGEYTQVGNITKTKTETRTFDAAGKSVKDVMQSIFTLEVAGTKTSSPSTSAPMLYAKVNGAGAEVAAAKEYEYGTYLADVRFAGPAFTKGTYSTPTPASQQQLTAWETQGVNIGVTSGSDSNAGTCETVVVGDKNKDLDNPTLSAYNTNTSFYVKTRGYTAVDTMEAYTNLNRTNTAAGKAKVQFAADENMSFKNSGAFTGFRNCFWGFIKDGETKLDFDNLTSAQMRALIANQKMAGKSLPATTTKATNFTVKAGTVQIYLIAPHDTKKNKIDVYNNSSLGAHMDFSNDNKRKQNAVSVDGANGYTAVAYDLWYLDSASPFATDCNLAVQWIAE